jgi:hypothetical protein
MSSTVNLKEKHFKLTNILCNFVFGFKDPFTTVENPEFLALMNFFRAELQSSFSSNHKFIMG